MKTPASRTALIVAMVAGFALWGIASVITTRREPWDDGRFWCVIYPLAIAASGVLAYRFPHKPVLLNMILFESQFLAMLIRSGEVGSLWPLGMLLFAILALPAMLVAKIAASRSPHQASALSPDADQT